MIAHVGENADVEQECCVAGGIRKGVLIWTSGAVADDDGDPLWECWSLQLLSPGLANASMWARRVWELWEKKRKDQERRMFCRGVGMYICPNDTRLPRWKGLLIYAMDGRQEPCIIDRIHLLGSISFVDLQLATPRLPPRPSHCQRTATRQPRPEAALRRRPGRPAVNTLDSPHSCSCTHLLFLHSAARRPWQVLQAIWRPPTRPSRSPPLHRRSARPSRSAECPT